MAQVLAPSHRASSFPARALGRNRSPSKGALTAAARRHPEAATAAAARARHSADAPPAAGTRPHPDTAAAASSIPSSTPSSPGSHPQDYASSQSSPASTPSSSFSLDDFYDGDDDAALYSNAGGRGSLRDNAVVAAAVARKHRSALAASTVAPPRRERSSMPALLEMPKVPSRPDPAYISMGDDAAVQKEPARHVDYLSHAWCEEDIWCSWRHIVARRKTLDNAERLENASWRTWAKTQRRLKTVSPDKLNWMKDHDVTWLYGPLQTVDPNAINPDSPTARSHLSRSNSFICKKPILKRRNISEAMLQRSLSNSTLVRQAVACIASQESTQATSPAASSSSRFREHVPTPAPSPHDSSDYFSWHSDATSVSLDATTPGTEKRHIHFNNKVEQCIAVDKDLEEPEDSVAIDDDSSSDDGGIIMRASHGKERKLSHLAMPGTPRSSFSSDQQPKTTIAMLPSTTLKYRGDTPEPPERARTPRPGTAGSPGANGSGLARLLHHSSSAETLKPPRPSNNFLVDDDEDEDAALGWQPSTYSAGGIPMDYYNEEDEELEARGMRRTPSGMFMPYDDDEEAAGGPEGAGILGRVVDTVNTARDIAHVIWNVGWRR